MNGRQVENEFKATLGFGLLMASDRVLREAMTVYMTDPTKAGKITNVIAECVQKLQDLLPEQEEQQGEDEVVGGPDCPEGSKEVRGRCEPIV